MGANPTPPPPVLIRADLQTHTGNDNKDHDTGIYLVARSADGSTQLASCSNADNSGSDSTEYNDQSDHVVKLQTDSPGVFHDACSKFTLQLWYPGWHLLQAEPRPGDMLKVARGERRGLGGKTFYVRNSIRQATASHARLFGR